MDDDLEGMSFGKGTVRENLARAVAGGKVIAGADGTLAFPLRKSSDDFLFIRQLSRLRCEFHSGFVFDIAYGRAAVPHGCRDCYKIKIVPATLRGLVALRDLLEAEPYHAKCGLDLGNPFSQDIYAGYAYFHGLEAARVAWPGLRRAVDAEADLGPAVPVSIKRGCSDFEVACGRSDGWAFRDGMEALERHLAGRFQEKQSPAADYRQRRMVVMVHWLRIAFSIKDETYRDFTGGKPLYSPSLSYSPQDSAGS